MMVSVVVPTRNRAHLLSRLLEALEKQEYRPFEVIVVDDASTDATPQVLAGRQREDRMICRLERPSGSYAARNAGIEMARGEIVAFTDDDCEPQPGWLSALVAALGSDGVAAQGVTVAAGAVTPFTHQIEQRNSGPPYRTCNMAYRRSALQELGGFEPELRWYADNILGLRARRLGRVAFAPDAIVVHPARPKEWRDREMWGARFRADAVHRAWLRRLDAEPVSPPATALPILLWIVRPLLKSGGAHLRYLVRRPRRYVREARPMVREKIEMLRALREYWGGEVGDVHPSVSVVVVTRLRPHMLDGALAAISEQTYAPCEVLVVDHADDAETRRVVERWGMRYLTAGGTLGAARQLGVEAARGEIVAFTDDDCVPDPGWIEALVAVFGRRPQMLGVQGRTDAESGPVGSHAVRVGRPGRLYETCNIAYRREALQRAGGFDTRFTRWFEDTALAARVRRYGPIGFARDAVVVHRARPRTGLDRGGWEAVLRDEYLLARAYRSFYRRTRGPAFLPTVVARWLVGSPLKSLVRELPQGRRDPRGYGRFARGLLKERRELLRALWRKEWLGGGGEDVSPYDGDQDVPIHV